MNRPTGCTGPCGPRVKPDGVAPTRLAVILVSAIFVALAGAVQAQEYRFSSVSIEGSQRVEAGTILSYAGIARGQAISGGQLNAAYQRVLESGLFETVEMIPAGDELVIRVREWPTINRIAIEGNRRLDDDVLLEAIQSQPRRVFSPTLAEQDAAAITIAYQQAGRLAASVDPVIIRRSDNRVDLVFEVSEGRVVEIERLSFIGNRNFTDRRLRRVLETKQAGFLRALIRRDTFIPDRLEFDKQLLRDFYAARGYIDFRILSATSEFARERDAFFVTFTVQEGQSYKFGNITVTSELPEIDPDEYRKVLPVRTGATYSPMLVDAAIQRLERLATRQGLTFVRVDPRVTRNDHSLSLDVEFAMVRGPRIFVERIDIKGNATTLDRVIRQQFRTVEGDPFNPRAIRDAARRIEALDFFETANVEARPGTADDQVIIDVEVTEKPTGTLSFGASWGASSGFGLNAGFTERNFLGRGQYLGLGIATGTGTRTYNLDFAEPFFLGRDVTFRFESSYYTSSTNAIGASHASTLLDVRPSLEFPIGENRRLQLRYTFGSSRVHRVDTGNASHSGSSAILRAEQGFGTEYESAIGYRFSLDNRITGLNPDSGVLLRFGQDIGGLGGNLRYLRTTALFVAQRKLRNRDLTFRAILEGGALNRLGGNATKITERFFLSPDQLRGFEPRGVGPRDIKVDNQDALGGNYFAAARFEADFPLGLPEEYGITGGLFLDVGSVWGLDSIAGGPKGLNPVDADLHLRSSIGFSVLWKTPIGPLRLNFSQPLLKKASDRTRSFDLTVSTTF